MNKKKNQLFRIVGAMKPTEKAYFKKFGFKQEKQNEAMLSLFELTDRGLKKAGKFSEDKLNAAFTQKNPGQNYVKVKSRLLEQVLESLREYDRRGNEVEKVYDFIAYSESLRKRNLFYDAWNVLQKAERLAEELELIELLILIKSKKYYYEIFTQKYHGKYSDHSTISDLHQNLRTLEDRLESDLVTYRILHFQKSIGMPRKPEELKMLDELKQHPAFQEAYLPNLSSSQLNLAVALNGIYFSVGDTHSVLKVSEKLIGNYQPGDKLRKLNSAKYLSLFDSFLQAALLSVEIPLYESYYPVFQSTPTFGEDDKHLKMGIDLYTRSIYAIVARKLELIPGLVSEFNEIKEKSFIPNYRKVSLAYYMVFGPFLRGDHAVAFEHIQWMKNNRSLGMRYDIEVGILGMECIILLERGDLSLLEYHLRSFDDYLKRQGRKFAMEALMIQLIRKGLGHSTEAERMVDYKIIYASMNSTLKEHPAERVFLQAFDVLSWLESQIKNEPFEKWYYCNNIASNEC